MGVGWRGRGEQGGGRVRLRWSEGDRGRQRRRCREEHVGGHDQRVSAVTAVSSQHEAREAAHQRVHLRFSAIRPPSIAGVQKDDFQRQIEQRRRRPRDRRNLLLCDVAGGRQRREAATDVVVDVHDDGLLVPPARWTGRRIDALSTGPLVDGQSERVRDGGRLFRAQWGFVLPTAIRDELLRWTRGCLVVSVALVHQHAPLERAASRWLQRCVLVLVLHRSSGGKERRLGSSTALPTWRRLVDVVRAGPACDFLPLHPPSGALAAIHPSTHVLAAFRLHEGRLLSPPHRLYEEVAVGGVADVEGAVCDAVEVDEAAAVHRPPLLLLHLQLPHHEGRQLLVQEGALLL